MSPTDPPSADRRKTLPSVDELLRRQNVTDSGLPRTVLLRIARNVIANERQRLDGAASIVDRAEVRERVVSELQRRIGAERLRPLQSVINATGILLHTNLGRAPLSERAIERLQEAAGYCNVEWDAETGGRSRRGAYVESLFHELTGAEACLVVNNCAAATLLTLQTLAAGRSVVISRGQLVEIGGSYRLPEVFRAAGVTLKEIGTTNRTTLNDYEAAIDGDTAAILRVHQSNFRVVGFTAQVEIGALTALGRQSGLPVIDDLGSGCLSDLTRYGLDEPRVDQSLASGADLVLFSGDKLLGGPQAGIILGRRSLVDRLRENPLARAVRVDKLTLAALEATLESHLSGAAFKEIPVLRALAAGASSVRERCERVLALIGSDVVRAACTILPSEVEVGGGSVPGHALKSWAVAIRGQSADAIASALRQGQPPVVGRVQSEVVLLDLCTVGVEQESQLAEVLTTRLQDVL